MQTLLNLVQPCSVLLFLAAGILSLLTKNWLQALINLSIANANFWVFYGKEFIK